MKVLSIQTQFSQFKSSEYVLSENDESMNENLNEILSDASDSDSALITVAADTESSSVIFMT